jgi:hypothetical protein
MPEVEYHIEDDYRNLSIWPTDGYHPDEIEGPLAYMDFDEKRLFLPKDIDDKAVAGALPEIEKISARRRRDNLGGNEWKRLAEEASNLSQVQQISSYLNENGVETWLVSQSNIEDYLESEDEKEETFSVNSRNSFLDPTANFR